MVKFLKTQEYEVKDPKFLFPDNAGIDGFIPSNTETFRNKFAEKNPTFKFGILDKPNSNYFNTNTGAITIAPHCGVLIPSGLYIKIPSDSALIDFNKSGIATKRNLDTGACIIDYSYQGIVHYHLWNVSDNFVTINCDEKIMQMVEVKIGNGAEVVEGISPDEFFEEKSSRADGGFGSTGLV